MEGCRLSEELHARLLQEATLGRPPDVFFEYVVGAIAHFGAAA